MFCKFFILAVSTLIMFKCMIKLYNYHKKNETAAGCNAPKPDGFRESRFPDPGYRILL